MVQFKENAWTDGWKDGQTSFYRTLPATTGSPKNTGEDMLVQNVKPINLETTLVDPLIFESVMKM